METEETITLKSTAKIKRIKRVKYLDWRCLTNPFHLLPKLLDNAKAREFQTEQLERESRPKSTGFFGSFIDGIALLGKKPKGDEYYEGYKMGALDAIELCKHYFVSDAISKEKQDKLIKFLHDEGIFIWSNCGTGSIMFGNMLKKGEYYEYELVYE